MFDYVKVCQPLPDNWVAPSGTTFQTKDFDSVMTTVWITPEGRLMIEDSEWEVVPEDERPYPGETGLRSIIGSMRTVNRRWRDLDFHGWFFFYGSEDPSDSKTPYYHCNGKRVSIEGDIELPPLIWHSYRAKFTDGQLIEIINFDTP